MNKTIRNALRNIAIAGAAAYFLNNIWFPTRECKSAYILIDKDIVAKTNIESYLDSCDASADDLIYDYLKLANMSILNYFSEGYSDNVKSKHDVRQMLDSKVAECTNTSKLTYSNYLFLVTKNNNFDLIDKVRIAVGYMKAENVWKGHAWLEMKTDNHWKVFETTAGYGLSKDHINKNFYDDNFLQDSQISKFYPLFYMQLDNEFKMKKEYNWANILLDKRGMAYLIFLD